MGYIVQLEVYKVPFMVRGTTISVFRFSIETDCMNPQKFRFLNVRLLNFISVKANHS